MKEEFELELRHLRVLEVMLREHSMTRAAQVLRVTQPALSRTLANLRVYFADPLFVRAGQRMEPTSKALYLGTAISSILDDVTSLRTTHVPFDPAVSTRTFRFSVVDAGIIRLLPPLIGVLRQRAPKVHLRVVPIDIERLESSLESGSLDFAMGSFPSLTKRIRRQPLWTVRYVSAVRRDHPRLGEKVSPQAFAAEKHVLVSTAGTGHAHLRAERALEKAIPAENITYRVPSFVTAAVLARMSDTVVTLPEQMALALEDYLGLKLFTTPVKLPAIDVSQYWHERFHYEPGNRWIREVFSTQFGTAS